MRHGKNTSYTPRTPQRNGILRIINEAEATTLKVSTTLSVSVIVVIPRCVDGVVELITITEDNDFKPGTSVTKIPSGSVDTLLDRDFSAAAIREAKAETGYSISDLFFCFAAEFTTTRPGEQHYKVVYIAKQHSKMGYPEEKGITSVDWRKADENFGKYTINSQRTMLQPIFEKMATINADYALAIMNLHTKFEKPSEGVYHVNG